MYPTMPRLSSVGEPAHSFGAERHSRSRFIISVYVKLRELAARLECVLEGDGDIDILRVTGLTAAGPGDVTFLANQKYEKALAGTRASAVILHTDGPAAPCAM